MMCVQTKKIRIFLLSFGSFLFLGVVLRFLPMQASACNLGVGLGLGNGWFVFFGVALLAYLASRSLQRDAGRWELVSMALLATGALLNIFDRLYYGCVVDTMPFFGLFWFNVADVYITGGAVLYVFSIYKTK